MADTDTETLPNGTGALSEEDERLKQRPADIDADVREMERRKRVEALMSSKLFREELERVLDQQLHEGGDAPLLQRIREMVGGRMHTGSLRGPSCVLPINDIRGIEGVGYEKGEKILRCKLAAVYRLVDLFGWTQTGITGQVTARLNTAMEQILTTPRGLLPHEVTASSLVKVDIQGAVQDPGTTNFPPNQEGFSIHGAVHAARPDVRCVVHVRSAAALAVSAMKRGLLPLCDEACVLGEIAYHRVPHGILDNEEQEKLVRALGPHARVLMLASGGALCCGGTLEEAFHHARYLAAACDVQLRVATLPVDELHLIDEQTRKQIYEASRKPPAEQTKWRVGGEEFEALMRMLDNAGFRTGYIYRHPLIKNEAPKPKSDVEVPPAVSSLGYLLEEEELYRQGIWKKGTGRTGERTRWLNSPNVYQKVELLETGTTDPRKITKWVDANNEEWVQDGSPSHSSTPVKIDTLQFVPKNTNPKEFKALQQQIKDNRRADKISAGPQSHILEGVTWDDAARLVGEDAQNTHTGDHVVLMGAASKGIIQRGYQHNASVYSAPYARNPFDHISDREIDEYRRTVERKQRSDYDTDLSESEALQITSPASARSETEEESRDEHRVLRIETKQAPVRSQPEVVLSDDFLNSERAHADRTKDPNLLPDEVVFTDSPLASSVTSPVVVRAQQNVVRGTLNPEELTKTQSEALTSNKRSKHEFPRNTNFDNVLKIFESPKNAATDTQKHPKCKISLAPKLINDNNSSVDAYSEAAYPKFSDVNSQVSKTTKMTSDAISSVEVNSEAAVAYPKFTDNNSQFSKNVSDGTSKSADVKYGALALYHGGHASSRSSLSSIPSIEWDGRCKSENALFSQSLPRKFKCSLNRIYRSQSHSGFVNYNKDPEPAHFHLPKCRSCGTSYSSYTWELTKEEKKNKTPSSMYFSVDNIHQKCLEEARNSASVVKITEKFVPVYKVAKIQDTDSEFVESQEFTEDNYIGDIGHSFSSENQTVLETAHDSEVTMTEATVKNDAKIKNATINTSNNDNLYRAEAVSVTSQVEDINNNTLESVEGEYHSFIDDMDFAEAVYESPVKELVEKDIRDYSVPIDFYCADYKRDSPKMSPQKRIIDENIKATILEAILEESKSSYDDSGNSSNDKVDIKPDITKDNENALNQDKQEQEAVIGEAIDKITIESSSKKTDQELLLELPKNVNDVVEIISPRSASCEVVGEDELLIESLPHDVLEIQGEPNESPIEGNEFAPLELCTESCDDPSHSNEKFAHKIVMTLLERSVAACTLKEEISNCDTKLTTEMLESEFLYVKDSFIVNEDESEFTNNEIESGSNIVQTAVDIYSNIDEDQELDNVIIESVFDNMIKILSNDATPSKTTTVSTDCSTTNALDTKSFNSTTEFENYEEIVEVVSKILDIIDLYEDNHDTLEKSTRECTLLSIIDLKSLDSTAEFEKYEAVADVVATVLDKLHLTVENNDLFAFLLKGKSKSLFDIQVKDLDIKSDAERSDGKSLDSIDMEIAEILDSRDSNEEPSKYDFDAKLEKDTLPKSDSKIDIDLRRETLLMPKCINEDVYDSNASNSRHANSVDTPSDNDSLASIEEFSIMKMIQDIELTYDPSNTTTESSDTESSTFTCRIIEGILYYIFDQVFVKLNQKSKSLNKKSMKRVVTVVDFEDILLTTSPLLLGIESCSLENAENLDSQKEYAQDVNICNDDISKLVAQTIPEKKSEIHNFEENDFNRRSPTIQNINLDAITKENCENSYGQESQNITNFVDEKPNIVKEKDLLFEDLHTSSICISREIKLENAETHRPLHEEIEIQQSCERTEQSDVNTDVSNTEVEKRTEGIIVNLVCETQTQYITESEQRVNHLEIHKTVYNNNETETTSLVNSAEIIAGNVVDITNSELSHINFNANKGVKVDIVYESPDYNEKSSLAVSDSDTTFNMSHTLDEKDTIIEENSTCDLQIQTDLWMCDVQMQTTPTSLISVCEAETHHNSESEPSVSNLEVENYSVGSLNIKANNTDFNSNESETSCRLLCSSENITDNVVDAKDSESPHIKYNATEETKVDIFYVSPDFNEDSSLTVSNSDITFNISSTLDENDTNVGKNSKSDLQIQSSSILAGEAEKQNISKSEPSESNLEVENTSVGSLNTEVYKTDSNNNESETSSLLSSSGNITDARDSGSSLIKYNATKKTEVDISDCSFAASVSDTKFSSSSTVDKKDAKVDHDPNCDLQRQTSLTLISNYSMLNSANNVPTHVESTATVDTCEVPKYEDNLNITNESCLSIEISRVSDYFEITDQSNTSLNTSEEEILQVVKQAIMFSEYYEQDAVDKENVIDKNVTTSDIIAETSTDSENNAHGDGSHFKNEEENSEDFYEKEGERQEMTTLYVSNVTSSSNSVMIHEKDTSVSVSKEFVSFITKEQILSSAISQHLVDQTHTTSKVYDEDTVVDKELSVEHSKEQCLDSDNNCTSSQEEIVDLVDDNSVKITKNEVKEMYLAHEILKPHSKDTGFDCMNEETLDFGEESQIGTDSDRDINTVEESISGSLELTEEKYVTHDNSKEQMIFYSKENYTGIEVTNKDVIIHYNIETAEQLDLTYDQNLSIEDFKQQKLDSSDEKVCSMSNSKESTELSGDDTTCSENWKNDETYIIPDMNTAFLEPNYSRSSSPILESSLFETCTESPIRNTNIANRDSDIHSFYEKDDSMLGSPFGKPPTVLSMSQCSSSGGIKYWLSFDDSLTEEKEKPNFKFGRRSKECNFPSFVTVNFNNKEKKRKEFVLREDQQSSSDRRASVFDFHQSEAKSSEAFLDDIAETNVTVLDADESFKRKGVIVAEANQSKDTNSKIEESFISCLSTEYQTCESGHNSMLSQHDEPKKVLIYDTRVDLHTRTVRRQYASWPPFEDTLFYRIISQFRMSESFDPNDFEDLKIDNSL